MHDAHDAGDKTVGREGIERPCVEPAREEQHALAGACRDGHRERHLEVVLLEARLAALDLHVDLRLDLRSRRVQVGSDTIDLTAREFALLEVFLRHPDQVLSREQILGHVWGYDFDPASNVVDVYVRALRTKIGAQRLETVRGMGYRLR